MLDGNGRHGARFSPEFTVLSERDTRNGSDELPTGSLELLLFSARSPSVQGVIKSYDPGTGDGVILCDTDLNEYDLDQRALEGSVFRMLRQGQRVIFDVADDGLATHIRLGSEVDMGTPGFPQRSTNEPAEEPA
jgi:cold shock CspA family protein